MIHDGQRLALSLEAFYDRLVVHARLDEFECYWTAHWRCLFRQPDLTHSAFPEFANQLKAFGKDLPSAWHTGVAGATISEVTRSGWGLKKVRT